MVFRTPGHILLALVSLPPLLQGQAASPQRDPAAITVLQQALAALGGPTANAAVSDATFSGAISPTPGSPMQPATFVWKTAGAEFRYELQVGGTTKVLLSGHGSPLYSTGGASEALPHYIDLANPPFHVPGAVLVQFLNDQAQSITLVGTATVNGTATTKVHISNSSDAASALVTVQDWYFDVLSGLPLRIEYRAPDTAHAEKYDSEAFESSDFRSVNGVMVPFQMVSFENGVQTAVVSVQSVLFNQGLAPSIFDNP